MNELKRKKGGQTDEPQVLRVSNTQTGKSWTEENSQHSWYHLALDFKNNVVYCDIECLLQHPDGTWYLLDECGNWTYLPDYYTVEVLA